MSFNSATFFRGIDEIKTRLDKIIQLMELRNSIYQAQNEMRAGEYLNCPCHNKGKTSAVNPCPVHG
uniref:Uncharacterized protein n=1 Tax=viral metagenome TaxID=1070528 RepID=A0A6M3LA36_9ZZZZ